MRTQLSPAEKDIIAKLRDYLRQLPTPENPADPKLQDQVVKQAAKLIRDLLNAPRDLADATGPLVTTPQVKEWFYISRQAVIKAIGDGRLLAIKRGRFWYFPAWQLVADHTIPANLSQVLSSLPGSYSALDQAAWFNQPQSGLRGRTPGECINNARDTEKLIKLAKHAS